jgi:hypothetical protein
VEALEKLMRHLGLLEKDRSAVNVQLLEKEYSGVAVQVNSQNDTRRESRAS